MRYLLLFLLVLMIFVIAITLGSNNDQVVTFNYLIAQGDYRVSTLLAILFGCGFVLGWLICGLFYLRTRIALGRAKRKIKRLEAQLATPNESVSASTVSKE
ncbi:LapA family protein [Serratia microhaemolytica]|uniref:LapA family protein n=1 Tax=Serratia microhaemolytica TaxID=2675110 RepID=UPI000FDD8954|nr:LapA family protein [Serratia microhaemolytica]